MIPTAKEFLEKTHAIKTKTLGVELWENVLHTDLIEFAKMHLKELFEEIKHGDQEHQDWLENKMKEYSENIK